MRKLNVLFLQSQTYFGADSMIHGLIMSALDRERVNVHVACNVGPDGKSAALTALSRIPNLAIVPTDFGPTLNERTRLEKVKGIVQVAPMLKSFASLVAYCRKHHIDVVHGTEKPRDAFYGLLLAKAIGARAVTHLHVKVENWISPLTRFAMKWDDALLGVSAFVADSTVALGYDPARTYYVLNALDVSRWDPSTDGSALRREYGLDQETPLLAVVSRLFHWKGHTELLQALDLVRRELPAVRLLLVGEDDPRAVPGSRSYSAELRELAAKLDLGEHVIFTGFRADVARIMAACDVFAMPSFEEPFGVVYLEALAMKRPVIALESGGVPQVVDHGVTGLLSRRGDIEGLARNIVELLRDPERRRRMGEAGRRRVEDFYSPVRLATEVEALYRSLLGWEFDAELVHRYGTSVASPHLASAV